MGFVVDAAKKLLMKVARTILNGTIIPGINGVLSNILGDVLDPTKMIVGMVSDGEAWRGVGANAFVEEVSNEVIPKVQQVTEQIQSLGKNIQTAVDTLDRADEEAQRLIQSRLCDQFDFYR